MGNLEVKYTATQIQAFLNEHFPQLNDDKQCFFIDDVTAGKAHMRFEPDERHLRPGGTISGPSLFALADYAAYVAVLGAIGPVGLAVTTNLNINFLRKPEPRTILCDAKIIKLGRQLCVLDIGISMLGSEELIAHATATYSIPPNKSAN